MAVREYLEIAPDSLEQIGVDGWEVLDTQERQEPVAETGLAFEPSPNCPQKFLCKGNKACSGKCTSAILEYAGVTMSESGDNYND